jgi:outer membrane protein assembly factor BamB
MRTLRTAATWHLLALIVVGATSTGAQADAPMFRGDPAHRGVYESSKVPTLSSTRWKFATKGKIVSTPAVVAGTVYVGSGDHALYALDAATGGLRWRYVTGGGVDSSPAVANGLVFVVSRDGNLHAIDAASGKPAWKFATAGERRFRAPGIHGALPRTEAMPDPFDVFLSSPVVDGSTVYFGSGDQHVYAVDAATGALRWKHRTGNVVHATPAVAQGVVYVGSFDRYLYALDGRSGTVLWTFETGDDTDIYNQVGIASSAAVGDDTVYFGCRDGHLYAVDAKRGTLRFAHDTRKGWVIASPALARGVVYFPTSDGQRFKALDARSGATLHDFSNKAVSFSSPAVVDTTVFYGTSDGWLHAVDAGSGKTVAEFATDGARQNGARYVDAEGRIDYSKIYSGSTLDAMIVGLDRLYSLGSVLSSPVVVDGVVYFGSTDGNVYAVQ